MKDHGLVGKINKGFRQAKGEGTESGAEATDQDEGLHGYREKKQSAGSGFELQSSKVRQSVCRTPSPAVCTLLL